MRYCAKCRIGTFDPQGLCILCGAPDRPPSRAARLAEQSGALLSIMLHPIVVAAVCAAGALLLFSLVSRANGHGALPALPGRFARFAPLDPAATLALAHTSPGSAAAQFLLPVLLQGLLFSLLLMAVFFIARRRQARQPRQPDARFAGHI